LLHHRIAVTPLFKGGKGGFAVDCLSLQNQLQAFPHPFYLTNWKPPEKRLQFNYFVIVFEIQAVYFMAMKPPRHRLKV